MSDDRKIYPAIIVLLAICLSYFIELYRTGVVRLPQRTSRTGKTLRYAIALFAVAFISLVFSLSVIRYIENRLEFYDNAIFACNNVTTHINKIEANNRIVELNMQNLTPAPRKLIESNLALIRIIDSNVSSYAIDVDLKDIQTIKHFYEAQSLNRSSTLTDSAAAADSIHEIFSGAQRSSIIFHDFKKDIDKYSSTLALLKNSSILLSFVFGLSIIFLFISRLILTHLDLNTSNMPSIKKTFHKLR
jgi:hypothetical protein